MTFNYRFYLIMFYFH